MNRHRSRLVEVLHRAETGPIIEEADFERKLVAPGIKKLIEKYKIKFDGITVVPDDDDLADRVFQAGMELAVQLGYFCQNTSRQILWSKKELEEGLRYCASEATFGMDNDAVVCRTRRPDDSKRVMIVGGAYGVVFPEKMFVPAMLSFAKESVIDIIENATIETVYGNPTKAGSPWEVLAGWREAELSMEVINRAGRPGMPIGCVENTPTCLAEISASSWGGFRPSDWHHVSTISEFKTNYDYLSIVTHINRIGGTLEAYYNPIYGGYVGNEAGVAIAIVAALVLMNQIYMTHTCSTRPDHPFLGCNTTPELLWAMSVGMQALSRNTNLLVGTLVGPAGGPGTKTMLYELAAYTLACNTSGQSHLEASHSAGGHIPRHVSGLDAKFCGDVTRATSGMTRKEANGIVNRLLDIYKPQLDKKPIGKPFEEVYNLDTVEPTAEWRGMYDEVCEELVAMGIQLNSIV
jgi:methylamine---corrinoid protein Co-methyltransferase